MKEKIALVAFQGEPMCFMHVLLNARDMGAKGWDVKIIMEGAAAGLIARLADSKEPFSDLYAEVRDQGLIDSVCRACAAKMGSLEAAEQQGLRIVGDMKGHPPLCDYIEQGYRVVTF